MKDILFNLALIDTINFCKAHNIPANGRNGNGSHLVKYPRRWTYALVESDTGRAIVTVTFYKNQVPTHFITPPVNVCGYQPSFPGSRGCRKTAVKDGYCQEHQ